MALTYISNIVVPEVFDAYMSEDFLAKSKLITSGAVRSDSRLDRLMREEGGFSVNLPFFKPYEGDAQVITEGTALSFNRVTARNQIAAKLIRGDLIGSTQLASVGAGEDIIAYIRTTIGQKIQKDRQTALINSLTGIFGTALADHVNDISSETGAAAVISANALIDTTALMGDNYGELSLIAMHSATFFALKKAGVIDDTVIVDSDTGRANHYYSINGTDIIVDDNMPVSNGVYTTYLLGRGSIAFGAGLPSTMPSLEDYNDVAKSESGVVYRDGYIMHPVGVSFKGTPSGATATNAELATTSNWELGFDKKNIPMAAIKHLVVEASAS
jgi:hypothetical protein